MNPIVRYLAGGALALSSQGVFALSFGLPSAMNGTGSSLPMQLQDVRPVGASMKTAALQQVDRTNKGNRLPHLNAAPDSVQHGNEVVSNDAARKLMKPAIRPAKREVEPKLPEGCNSSVSPLSDRIAAAQASNCITSLELPFKVASAN